MRSGEWRGAVGDGTECPSVAGEQYVCDNFLYV